jgi:hypothetical protein
MSYSKYAIQKGDVMTFGEVVVLIALAALLLAWGATFLRISAWWVLVVACIPTAAIVVLTELELDEPCGRAGIRGVPYEIMEVGLVLSLTLWTAAAVAGVVDGVRLTRAGRHDAALARYLGCPLASLLGGGTAFVAFLYAALHCLD